MRLNITKKTRYENKEAKRRHEKKGEQRKQRRNQRDKKKISERGITVKLRSHEM